MSILVSVLDASSAARMAPDLSGLALSLITVALAALTAVAAVFTVYYAYQAAVVGRGTVAELQKLTREASIETAAQQEMVKAIGDLVASSNTTAEVLHAVFLESQAGREVEALLNVRRALAEVSGASHRVVVDHQPTFLFFLARQTLRAALAGVPSAEKTLPGAMGVSTRNDVDLARSAEHEMERELNVALEAAMAKLQLAGARVSGSIKTPTP